MSNEYSRTPSYEPDIKAFREKKENAFANREKMEYCYHALLTQQIKFKNKEVGKKFESILNLIGDNQKTKHAEDFSVKQLQKKIDVIEGVINKNKNDVHIQSFIDKLKDYKNAILDYKNVLVTFSASHQKILQSQHARNRNLHHGIEKNKAKTAFSFFKKAMEYSSVVGASYHLGRAIGRRLEAKKASKENKSIAEETPKPNRLKR